MTQTIMQQLNVTQGVEVFEQDGCDALTVVDMGEMVSLSQMAEDETFHNVVIGLEQARKLMSQLEAILA